MKSTFARRVGRVCCQALASISVLLCAVVAAAQTPKRVALLVGVGDYRQTSKLEGPANDVTALRDVLLRRWGFQAQDIRTLVDKQATRVNILAELVALANRSSANDEVLVYFSGHGTSALDAGTQSAFSIPLPHSSGAFVPFDFEPQAGASFQMGSHERNNERPIHSVSVKSFSDKVCHCVIDKDRVTVRCIRCNVANIVKRSAEFFHRFFPV